MATRGIALGRIIDWFKNCDPEEGKFAIHRAANILQARDAQVARADAAGKVKRAKRAAPKPSVVHTDEAEHLDAQERPERGISA